MKTIIVIVEDVHERTEYSRGSQARYIHRRAVNLPFAPRSGDEIVVTRGNKLRVVRCDCFLFNGAIEVVCAIRTYLTAFKPVRDRDAAAGLWTKDLHKLLKRNRFTTKKTSPNETY